MNTLYKPQGYTSLAPYFIVKDAGRLVQLLEQIFQAQVRRRFDMPDGSIMHIEVQIDDTIIMMGEASEAYPANQLLLHVYVPDVMTTYERAITLGCDVIDRPKQREGDTDLRGSFRDFAGNTWAIATQMAQ